MIPRYSRPKLEKIWSLENKFSIFLEIECLISEKLAINKVIPKQAAIDIRKKSDTFGKFIQIELNENKSETLFLPAGVAHGFLSLSDSILLYLVSGTYLKEFERGINYKSIDLHLPEEPSIINERDINWPNFKEAEYYEEDL